MLYSKACSSFATVLWCHTSSSGCVLDCLDRLAPRRVSMAFSISAFLSLSFSAITLHKNPTGMHRASVLTTAECLSSMVQLWLLMHARGLQVPYSCSQSHSSSVPVCHSRVQLIPKSLQLVFRYCRCYCCCLVTVSVTVPVTATVTVTMTMTRTATSDSSCLGRTCWSSAVRER